MKVAPKRDEALGGNEGSGKTAKQDQQRTHRTVLRRTPQGEAALAAAEALFPCLRPTRFQRRRRS